jgi:hypothetical protein
MKVFIQERLPSLILANSSFSIESIAPKTSFFSASYFVKNIENKKNLEACDAMKNLIIKNDFNKNLIKDFKKMRGKILLNKKALKIIQNLKKTNNDYHGGQDHYIIEGLGQYVKYKFKADRKKRILNRLIKLFPIFIQKLLIHFISIFN